MNNKTANLYQSADVTGQLALRLTRMQPGDFPDAVFTTAKACLLDIIGVGLAGCDDEAVQILEDVVCSFGSKEQVTVIGRARKVSVSDAALMNGTIAHALDFDDMHLESSMHPSAPVIAAALAVAEHLGASGSELLRAIALGLETCTRIGEAVNPAHYQKGWHATATLGHFGAAVAAGTLLHLTSEQMVAALGIAGTQAAGLKEPFGTMTKPLHAGHAARDGVMAAYLAARGFTCTTRILEGAAGFGKVMSENADWSLLLDHWGERWSMSRILYKPHASSFCSQALIEGTIELRQRHDLKDEQVAAIRGVVSKMSFQNATIGEPKTGLEGKFSLTFCAAQALAYRQATQHDYSDERVAEQRIHDLRSRVTISVGEGLRWPEAIVEIDTRDGRTLRQAIDLEVRMATAEQKWSLIEAKFRRITATLLAEKDRDALVSAVGALEQVQDLGQLMALSSRRTAA